MWSQVIKPKAPKPSPQNQQITSQYSQCQIVETFHETSFYKH
jgi:hypothetical protein